jgi:hypothetical protein
VHVEVRVHAQHHLLDHIARVLAETPLLAGPLATSISPFAPWALRRGPKVRRTDDDTVTGHATGEPLCGPAPVPRAVTGRRPG